MDDQVPEEFLPQIKEKGAPEEDGGLGGLFADGNSDNEDDSDDDQFEDVTIGRSRILTGRLQRQS